MTQTQLDLYSTLGLNKKCSLADIKKAYKKLALKFHPDKQNSTLSEEEQLKVKQQFQDIAFAYSVLSDEAKRKQYDTTGSTQDLSFDGFSWEEYFQQLYQKLRMEDILDFEKKYKYSNEEKEELIVIYEKTKGNWKKILESMPLSSVDEIPRYQDILNEAVKEGKANEYPGLNQKEFKSLKRKAKKEAQEAEAYKKELGISEGNSDQNELIKQIQKKNESQFDDLILKLEAKYAKPKKSAKKPKRSE